MKKSIYLLIGSEAEKTVKAAIRLCQILEHYHTMVVTDRNNRQWLNESGISNVIYVDASNPGAIKSCDCIVTVGGDGTVLRGASKAIRADKPLVGVNTGKVGFLAKIPEKIPKKTVENLVRDKYPELRLMTLAAEWKLKSLDYVLNDITLSGNVDQGMNLFQVFCDDEPVASWRSDGIVLFTPAGSTAYAYSAGGPALDLNLQVIGVVPLCPQNGRGNALICDGSRRISVLVLGHATNVYADGVERGIAETGDAIVISGGKRQARFIQPDRSWNIKKLNKRLSELV